MSSVAAHLGMFSAADLVKAHENTPMIAFETSQVTCTTFIVYILCIIGFRGELEGMFGFETVMLIVALPRLDIYAL